MPCPEFLNCLIATRLKTKVRQRNSRQQFNNSTIWQFKNGFSLVEIVLAVLLISFIVIVLLSSSGSFTKLYKSSLQATAANIATAEIENLRKTDFASLPPSGPISDPDLSKLPQSSATRTISDYQGNNKIKQALVQVNWQESGVSKSIKMGTLIYENGL